MRKEKRIKKLGAWANVPWQNERMKYVQAQTQIEGWI